MRQPICLLAALLLAACGYTPAPTIDTGTAAYQKDLDACTGKTVADVDHQNAKRALDWFASPFTRWGQIRDAKTACMASKGYAGLRWCTASELQNARATGTVVVTAAGIQCADPATR